MTSEEFARESWQSSGNGADLPPLEELRSKADKFQRQIRRRNMAEYVVGTIVILWFGWITVFGPMPWTPPVIPPNLVRLGSALFMIGTAIALWQLHHRASPLAPPSGGGHRSVLDFQRSELVRQRDALGNVFFWYILPFIPGTCVMFFVPLALSPEIGSSDWFKVLAKLSIIPLIFICVWWVNKLGARRLQKQIDEIDALRGE